MLYVVSAHSARALRFESGDLHARSAQSYRICLELNIQVSKQNCKYKIEFKQKCIFYNIFIFSGNSSHSLFFNKITINMGSKT